MPAGLVGRVFVKKGDGISIPDQVVFVTKKFNSDKPDTDAGYQVNQVTLNQAGYLLSPYRPDLALQPFFSVNPQTNAVIPNPRAAYAVGVQSVMAAVSAFDQTSPTSANSALNQGAATGRF